MFGHAAHILEAKMAKRDNGEGSLFYDKVLKIWAFQVSYIKDGKRKRKKFKSKNNIMFLKNLK